LVENAKTADTRIGYQIKAAELVARLGEVETARMEFQTILDRLRPGSWLHTDVRGRLERSFMSAGDVDGLIRFYNEQSDRSPDDLTWLVRLGEVLMGSGHDSDAEKALRKAINRSPNDVSARLALCEVLAGDGRYGEAASQIDHLLDSDPGNPDYLMRLAEIRISDLSMSLEDRQTEAAEAWERIVRPRADDAVMLAAVAKKMHSIDRTDRAIELYRTAIDAAPDAAQYREYLGEFLHHLGRKDEAIAVWKSIASDDRRGPDNLIRLAEIFASFDNLKLSLETWRDAATYDLSLDQRRRFAAALSSAGHHDDALKQLDSASTLAQNDEEIEQLMRDRIGVLQAAGRLAERITEVVVDVPTAENQRYLALLYQANGQLGFASFAIDEAMKLDPNDAGILRDAVDISEQFGRLAHAATLLEKLARRDELFRINHLRRLVQIREQLGEFEPALAAAQEMIDANPASPDPYRLYADIALSIGKDEDGERMLRRAIIVAPRDIPPRVMLATRLADRFQTGDAIELLWEAVGYENNLHARTELVNKLVPLYARRGEIDQLVGRLERFELDAFTEKTKQLLIARVWTSVKDYKQAQIALNRSLTKQPRDADLLEAMVDSLLESGDVASAVNYQGRLVKVQDTPANQTRLASLELQAGLITPLEAKTREIKATDDVKRMAVIALRDAEKDPEQSAELCRVVLEKNPELWDVKIVLAQLLLQSDLPERAEHLAEAGRLAAEVAGLKLNDDAASPAFGSQGGAAASASPVVLNAYTNLQRNAYVYQRSGSGTTVQVPVNLSVPSAAGQSRSSATAMLRLQALPGSAFAMDRESFPQSTALALATILRLNDRRVSSRQISGQKSFSFGFGSNYIKPDDYFQAKWTAVTAQILSAVEVSKLTDHPLSISQAMEKLYSPPDIDSDDVDTLRSAVAIHRIKTTLEGNNDPVPSEIVWRIAEIDPAGDHWALTELLALRSGIRRQVESDPLATIEKLDDKQLEILRRLCVRHQELAAAQPRDVNEILADLQFRNYLIAEYRLAGKSSSLGLDENESTAASGFFTALTEIEAALIENNIAHADKVVDRLIHAARSIEIGEINSKHADAWPATWMVSAQSPAQVDFLRRHREQFIDCWIAYCSRRMVLSQGNFSPSELFEGERIQIVTPIIDPDAAKQKYQIFTLQRPLSDRLFDGQLVRGLIPLLPKQIAAKSSRRTELMVNGLIDRLGRPMDD
ncbi:MAG: tetratricopeptide repeat protein, partial [Planctomycetales bacterium]|nr:tetratricopeptide repeat protein [Planctomycetales bacterium]